MNIPKSKYTIEIKYKTSPLQIAILAVVVLIIVWSSLREMSPV